MIFEITFSPKAEETYDAIITQFRERWGEHFVIKLESKLNKCFENILATPDMYPVVDENIDLRKCILHKNCSMLYKVSGNIILVTYFWDNRQDPFYKTFNK